MAQPTKTVEEIIVDFELQVNDVTELSSDEELALLNKIYIRVCNKMPWEFLKTVATGTILSDSTSSYITIPSDFGYFVENESWLVNGTAYNPFYIINIAQKRNYLNRNNYAYYDFAGGKIRFLGTPAQTSYEFNYIKVPALLEAGDSPIFPGQFHDMIQFGMANDNDILQLSPKATAYAKENKDKFEEYLLDMKYWNSQFLLNQNT